MAERSRLGSSSPVRSTRSPYGAGYAEHQYDPEEQYGPSQTAKQQHSGEGEVNDTQAPPSALPQKPATGFERFLERGLAMAGARAGGGSDKSTGAVYQSGWAKGLTKGQAIEKARDMYAGLDDRVRQKYEGQANMGDVRSGREIAAESQYQAERAEALGLTPRTEAPTQQNGGLVPVAVPGPGGRTSWRYVPAAQSPPSREYSASGATATQPQGTAPVAPAPPQGAAATPAQAPAASAAPQGRGTIGGKPTEEVLGPGKGPGIFTQNADGSQTKHTPTGATGQERDQAGNLLHFDKWATSRIPAPGQAPAQPQVSASAENRFKAVSGPSPMEKIAPTGSNAQDFNLQKAFGFSDAEYADIQKQAREAVEAKYPTPVKPAGPTQEAPAAPAPQETPATSGPVQAPAAQPSAPAPRREDAPFTNTAKALGIGGAPNAIRAAGEGVQSAAYNAASKVSQGIEDTKQAGVRMAYDAASAVTGTVGAVKDTATTAASMAKYKADEVSSTFKQDLEQFKKTR